MWPLIMPKFNACLDLFTKIEYFPVTLIQGKLQNFSYLESFIQSQISSQVRLHYSPLGK